MTARLVDLINDLAEALRALAPRRAERALQHVLTVSPQAEKTTVTQLAIPRRELDLADLTIGDRPVSQAERRPECQGRPPADEPASSRLFQPSPASPSRSSQSQHSSPLPPSPSPPQTLEREIVLEDAFAALRPGES